MENNSGVDSRIHGNDTQGCSTDKMPCVKALIGVSVIALICLSAFLGLKARNEWRQGEFIGRAIERDTISVSGEGRVYAVPDVAVVDLGMTVEKKQVADAQKENAKVMSALREALKVFGVVDKDVQTSNYSVYPAYDWLNGKQIFRGYTVTQSLQVKVRKPETLSDILTKAGELGANQIGGVNFTVDDPDTLRTEARNKAIEQAKKKAVDLAGVSGLKLGRVITVNEYGGEPTMANAYDAKSMNGYGMGGAESAPIPALASGQTEIKVTATVTYEVH